MDQPDAGTDEYNLGDAAKTDSIIGSELSEIKADSKAESTENLKLKLKRNDIDTSTKELSAVQKPDKDASKLKKRKEKQFSK